MSNPLVRVMLVNDLKRILASLAVDTDTFSDEDLNAIALAAIDIQDLIDGELFRRDVQRKQESKP